MKLQNHKVTGIEFARARIIGAIIKPTVVVLHDTAGRLDHGNSANYLRSAPGGTTVHFIIERNGEIQQQVPTNRRAGHAGRSVYHGRKNVNDFSIGIEIVNPGRMTGAGDGKVRTWFNQDFEQSDLGIERASTPEHGAGWWMDYTPQQITAVTKLLNCLFDRIDTLVDIVPHWFVSPGRKVDTNPLFPLEQVKAQVLGRDDRIGDSFDEIADDEADRPIVRVTTNGSGLNMRRWPSFNPNIITQIPDGVEVPVLSQGEFEGFSWAKVLFAGQEGWVVSHYLKFGYEGIV